VLRGLAVVSVTAAVAAGIGSAARTPFHRHTIPGYGTSISLPASWKTVDYRQILKPGELGTLRSVSQLHWGTVRLPAGRAAQLTYRLTINVHGRALSVQTLQYALLAGRRSVVVTYSTLPISTRFYSTVFTTSARSIRFS
jgi:hypothetical protein